MNKLSQTILGIERKEKDVFMQFSSMMMGKWNKFPESAAIEN